MNQTKLESLLEAFVNIGSGFFISLGVWIFIAAPIWGIEMHMLDNIGLCLIFTVASIIRSYVWRRFFNAGIHKVVHTLAKGLSTSGA